MFLHLGQNALVRADDIVGVFDLDNTTLGKKTREFLAAAEHRGVVNNVNAGLPKSFIIAAPRRHINRGEAVYISQLGAATLKRRMGSKMWMLTE